MNLLKVLITFIAATVMGALGQQLLGVTGMLIGSIGGMVFGWLDVRRLLTR